MSRAPRPWKAWQAGPVPSEYRGDPAYEVMGSQGYLRGVTRAWQNGWFAVMARPISTEWGEAIHVMVRNQPNTPVRNWLDLMRIKDELFGSDLTAVEIFPPRTQVVDQANMTHLWVLPEGLSLPFTLVRAEP